MCQCLIDQCLIKDTKWTYFMMKFKTTQWTDLLVYEV